MDKTLKLRAPAKINLGLTVLARRTDGFHEIESVMQQISLADVLLFEAVSGSGWHFVCTDQNLSGSDNLVCRAAALLEMQVEKPLAGVRINLFKNIPVEAGLAGGSSDAAAALMGLNLYWNLGLDQKTLLKIGSILGSDVPFCLNGGTALARGRGEQLSILPSLPFFWVVLALPNGLRVSTADAYNSFDTGRIGTPSLQPLVEAIKTGSKSNILGWIGSGFTNTLETAILPGSGLIQKVKRRLENRGLKPVLSGSGPTLFMLIDNYSLACMAVRLVEQEGCRAYLCWTNIRDSQEWRYV